MVAFMQVSCLRAASRCSARTRQRTYFSPSGGTTVEAAATGALSRMCSGARQIAFFQSFCSPAGAGGSVGHSVCGRPPDEIHCAGEEDGHAHLKIDKRKT